MAAQYQYLTGQSIKKSAAKALKQRIAAINAAAEGKKAQYNYNLSQAGQTYQPQRNAAYTDFMGAQRTLRERMANLGLGAGGGTSLTANAQNSAILQNNLTAANLAQQNYINEQNQALQGINTDTQSQIAQAKADNAAALRQTLMNQANQNLSYYTNLFLNKKLKKKQYQQYTGFKF